jgi:hypothetical protein
MTKPDTKTTLLGAALCACAGAFGCGGPGSVGSNADTTGFIDSDAQVGPDTVSVYLSSVRFPQACVDDTVQNARVLWLGVSLHVPGNQSSEPLNPGTYEIGSTLSPDGGSALFGYAQIITTGSGCPLSAHITSAASGTITLQRVSSSDVAGSYDIQFVDGSSSAGSFDAPVCNVGPSDGGIVSHC